MTVSDKEKLYKGDLEKNAEIQRITWIGLFINIFLSALKFTVGLLGRSHAVIADALHSVSDLSTDFAIIFGSKIWLKPADEDHPYGHRRVELIVTGIISIVLASVAIGIGYNAVRNIQSGYVRQPGSIAFIGVFISIICKEILYRWTLAVGKRVKSSAVIANAWHHRTDAFSSIPVAIAIAVAVINIKYSFLDHIGALIVSLFIMRASWGIMKEVLLEIIDTGAPKKCLAEIRDIALSIEGVNSIHALRTRRIGYGWYVDLHVQVNANLTVKKGHEISKKVKHDLYKKGPDILDAIVHLEPYE